MNLAYQNIPSLQEYALISQNKVRVELYTRSSKIWTYDRFDDIESTLHFASIDCHLNLADIYESVEFEVVQELIMPSE